MRFFILNLYFLNALYADLYLASAETIITDYAVPIGKEEAHITVCLQVYLKKKTVIDKKYKNLESFLESITGLEKVSVKEGDLLLMPANNLYILNTESSVYLISDFRSHFNIRELNAVSENLYECDYSASDELNYKGGFRALLKN